MSVRRFMIVQLLALFMCEAVGLRRDLGHLRDYGLQPVARTP
jgi:hypothetical protein